MGWVGQLIRIHTVSVDLNPAIQVDKNLGRSVVHMKISRMIRVKLSMGTYFTHGNAWHLINSVGVTWHGPFGSLRERKVNDQQYKRTTKQG